MHYKQAHAQPRSPARSRGLTQHVGMRLHLQPHGDGRPLDHPGKAGGRERRARSLTKTKGDSLEPPQRPKLVAK
jgi:hypothetical protein